MNDTVSRIGRIGIWSLQLRFGDAGEAVEAIAELDALGYGAAWVPGGIGGDLFGDLERLLDASERIVIASGILNIWKHDAADVGRWWAGLPQGKRDRLMLGLGISHEALIGDAYGKPVATMRAYLDALTAEGVPASNLCLAALGPKMLELSRDRTAGAHPYLVTPEHTRSARDVLGEGPMLAVGQGVVLESDPDVARALGRGMVEHYARLPNYVNSWKRLGFDEAEIASVSPRLIDALFAWGPVEAIVERVDAHLAAGASHVCLQVIPAGQGTGAEALLPAWRELAGALL